MVIIIIASICNADGSKGAYFMVGMDMPVISELNTMLTDNEYPELKNQLISYGFGVHVPVKERIMLGFEWHWLYGKEVTNNDESVKSSLSTNYWFFNLGYYVVSVANLNVYPFIGVGNGEMTLTMVDVVVPNFDEILDEPSGVTRLSTGGFLLNPSLGVDYTFRNLIIGIRGGYIFDPFTGDWKMEDADVSGGPDEGITGPFARIILGFGG